MLEWFICRQKAQESLESRPLMPFLDGLEDNE